MGETRKPRRTVMFVGHHGQPIRDDLVKDIMRRFRPGSLSNTTNEPATEETDEAQFAIWKSYREPKTLRFYYPKPLRPGESFRDGTVEVVVGVRTVARFELDNREMAMVPLFEREKDRWFEVVADRTRIDYDSAFDMAWFFDKVQQALPVFQPDFGFADIQSNVVKNIGDDPRRRVWPVLLYGSAMVKELGGRERLLEAPVWRVDELAGGSCWLQVAENPFVATQKQLASLAKYLGLEVRGG